MPIPATETLISLADAAALIPPRRGKRVSATSVWRWCKHGIQGVRLESSRRPDSGWLTSREAVYRFLAELAAVDRRPRPLSARAEHEAACCRLRAEGVM